MGLIVESSFVPGPMLARDILRATWNLYRRRWPTWLLLTMLAYLPYYLLFHASDIGATSGDAGLWAFLVGVGIAFQRVVMNGAGPIFVTDGLTGERASIWYALDLLVTQRLGRVFLMYLLTGIITELIASPLTLSLIYSPIPYEQVVAIWDVFPWIAGIGLLIIAGAIIITRKRQYLPVLLVLVLVVVYNFISLNHSPLDFTMRDMLVLFNRGTHWVMNALFFLIIPIVALDPGPLWRTAARGWRIAKANLRLIFILIFLVAVITSILRTLAQPVSALLPPLLPPDRTTFLGPWQLNTNYVNFMIYYIPLELLVVGVLIPLQTIFATLVTLDGYRMFSDEDEDDEWDEEDEEDEDEYAEVDVEKADIDEADSQLDALDPPDKAASAPIDEEEADDEIDDLDDSDDSDDWDEWDEWEAEKEQKKAAKRAERVARREAHLQAVAAQPLLTYRDLISFAGLIIVSMGLSYLWSIGMNALVSWLNQFVP